jgi:hypothetical protein
MVIVPLSALNRPRTVVNIMCLTANSTAVCAASIVQVRTVGAVSVAMAFVSFKCEVSDRPIY